MATGIMTRPRGRPRRFDDRRTEVLRTAARVFSDRGFRQATLEDVAGELGMTRPALYHYASSKDALLTECGDIARQALIEAIGRSHDEPTGGARLAAFFRRYTEIISDDFGRCFVLTDISEMSAEEGETTRKAQLALGTAVVGMIGEGIADKSVRPCDPAEVSRAMFAAFNGIARWRAVPDKRKPSDIARDFLDIFFQGLSPRD
jgi:AcrR family transcriptional regulator